MAKTRSVKQFISGAVAATAVVVLFSGVPAKDAAAQPANAPVSFADLAERLLPSVVNISTSQTVRPRENGNNNQRRSPFPPGSPFEEFFKDFFDRQQREGTPRRRTQSLGSGFVIDESGLIVTNNHVIAEADEITVIFHDDTRLKAKVLGRDAKTDLAVLKVEPVGKLKAVPFGDSSKTRVGDWVMAIGNPFGLGGTVTAGIVSARGRDINSGPYDDFLQTDASINRGNSGGPMFNLAGEVIGINTAIFSPSGGSVGIGFAVPSNLARPIITQLRDFGKARRGWLGVRIQTVTEEIAQGLGLKAPTGALVAGLTEDGPAEKGGIAVGDVILRFDGKEVEEMRRLPRVVAETDVGKAVAVTVWRKGREQKVSIVLGEFPEEDQQVAARTPSGEREKAPPVSALGLTMSSTNDEVREKFKLDDNVKGVVVTEVADGSAAAEKRVRAGDIIRKIGPEQTPVTSPGQVKEAIDEARKAKMRTILILVESGGNQRFVALRVDPEE